MDTNTRFGTDKSREHFYPQHFYPQHYDCNDYVYSASNSTLECGWCGKHLGNATQVVYLNGNQAVCDLCLLRAKVKDE